MLTQLALCCMAGSLGALVPFCFILLSPTPTLILCRSHDLSTHLYFVVTGDPLSACLVNIVLGFWF